MNCQLVLLAFIVCLLSAGCSSTAPKETDPNQSHLPLSADNEQQVVKHYLEKAEQRLIALEKVTQGRCLNGQMAITNGLFTRVKKEYDNAMYQDAFITLTDFDRQVRKTQCILAYVEGKFGCQITKKVSVLKHWYQEGRYEQCQSVSEPQLIADDDQQQVTTNDNPPVATTNSIALASANEHNEIIVETLHEFNSAAIKPIYFNTLDKVAQLMLTYPSTTLTVTGHADTIGSNQYNLDLGEQRAKAIADYLNQQGVNPKQVSIISRGEQDIRETELTDVARVFNRYTLLTVQLNIDGTENSQGVTND